MSSEKIRVIVESVHPLSEEQQTFLANEIKKTLSPQQASCYFALNPDLKEGLKVHFGSMVLDDSVQGKWQATRHSVEQDDLNKIEFKNIYLI